MRTKILILIIPILLLATFVKFYNQESGNILTGKMRNIESVNIIFDESNLSSINVDDTVLIQKIYDLIAATNTELHKNPSERDYQSSSPTFTIIVNYRNRKKDIITSTETGKFIYRILDNKGSWVGGHNEELEKFINLLTWIPLQ